MVSRVCAMQGGDKFCAPFFHPDGLDGVSHAKLFQKWQISGEQRFADVKTRMVRFFQQGHAVATLGQQRSGCRACGPTTDYQYVAARSTGGGCCGGSVHGLNRFVIHVPELYRIALVAPAMISSTSR
jgi:hypothetical protein